MRRRQPYRRRRLSLLIAGLCLAIGAPSPAAAQAADAPAEPRSGGLFGSGRWRVPPIAWAGSLAYDLRVASSSDPVGGASREHLVTGTVSAASSLYQPWFATVGGSLSLTTSRSSASEATNQSQFASGNLRLDLFPRSRFPFGFNFQVSDSRIDSGLHGGVDYRSTLLGLSQRYRPVDGSYNLSTNWQHRVYDALQSHDTQDTLNADYSTRWKANELSLAGSYSSGRRRASSEQSLFGTLVGRHHYSASSELSVDTMLNWSRTDDQLADFQSRIDTLQWSSTGLWHPERAPWTLSGSARAVTVQDDNGNTTSSVGLSAGGQYEVSPSLRLTGSLSANANRSAGASNQFAGAQGGASWQAESLKLLGASYERFASVGAGVQQGAGQRNLNLSLNGGHSITHAWPVGPQSSLSFSAAQTANASRSVTDPAPQDSLRDRSVMLAHNASVGWSTRSIDRSGFARLSLSDSREVGGGRSRFQLANFQLSGNFEIDRNQTLNGNLTLQAARQRAGDQQDVHSGTVEAGTRRSSNGRSGEIDYRYNRAFGVPRLRFSSRLQLAQDVQKQSGTLASIPDRETRWWENRLDWSVGRLETQFVLRSSWVDGVRRDLLMWRLQRAFGE